MQNAVNRRTVVAMLGSEPLDLVFGQALRPGAKVPKHLIGALGVSVLHRMTLKWEHIYSPNNVRSRDRDDCDSVDADKSTYAREIFWVDLPLTRVVFECALLTTYEYARTRQNVFQLADHQA